MTKSTALWTDYLKLLGKPVCCTADRTLYLVTPTPKYSKAQTMVVEAAQISAAHG